MGTLRLHYEEKNILRPKLIGAFFLLKLKVTKIPIQNGPFLAPWAALFSALEAIETTTPTFLDARDHAWSNSMGVVVSISLGKKSIFFMVPFSSVALYEYNK